MAAAVGRAATIECPVFFKQAGGKRQLLSELRKHVPEKFGRYFEPFAGGAALFFDLAPKSACLNDANPHMMAAYRALRDQPSRLIHALQDYAEKYAAGGEAYYYEARARQIHVQNGDVAAGAWFLFLNRTGFNGLWRVNSKGLFNVPHGAYKNPAICNRSVLQAASAALQGMALTCGDFERALRRQRQGDFVYCDPPYWPVGGYADFVNYTKEGFGPLDQERLRDVALRLKKAGVQVLLSNADLDPVHKLYAKSFEMRRVEARRAINSKATKRGNVGELLIW